WTTAVTGRCQRVCLERYLLLEILDALVLLGERSVLVSCLLKRCIALSLQLSLLCFVALLSTFSCPSQFLGLVCLLGLRHHLHRLRLMHDGRDLYCGGCYP